MTAQVGQHITPALRALLSALLVGAAYYFGAVLGLELKFSFTALSAIWPPNAIMLAVLLLTPMRRWWIYLLAAVPAHIAVHTPIGMPMWRMLWVIGFNTSLVVIAASGLRHFSGGSAMFDRKRSVLVFIITNIVAIGLACFISPSFVLSFMSPSFDSQFPIHANHWNVWWLVFFSNFLGFISLTPVIMLWIARGISSLRGASLRLYIEAFLITGGLLAVCVFLFIEEGADTSRALLYLPLPFLLYAAVRFGPAGTYSAILIFFLISIGSMIIGRGPFNPQSQVEELFSLQLFLISVSLPLTILAAVIQEHLRVTQALRESEARNSAMLRAVPDLIFLHGRDGIYLDYHVKDQRQLLVLPEQFLGKNMREVLPPNLAARFENSFEQAAQSGAPVLVEYSLPILGENRYYEARVVSCDSDKILSIVRDITERKRTEGELEARQNQFRFFLEHAPAAIAMFDLEMRYMLTSHRWLKDYRLGEQNVIGRSHYEVFPEIPERWKEIHQRCLAGAVETCEKDPFLRLDGTVDWVRWEVRPWYTASGKIGGIIMFTEVISERMRAEEALRESEERLRLAIEAGQLGVWDWDPRTNAVKWSKEHFTIFGLKPFSIEPDYYAWSGRVHPDDLPLAEAPMKDAIERQVEYQAQYRIVRPDGTIRWVDARGNPIFDEAGQCIRVMGLVADITERKRAEEALLESEERLRLAIEAGRMGVWDWDPRTDVIRWSKECFMIVGREPFSGNLTRNIWAECLFPDDLPRVIDTMKDAIERQVEYQAEYRVVWPDGTIHWVGSRGKPIYDEAGQCIRVMGLATDITERKEAEDALRASDEALRESYARIEYLAGRLIVAQEEERKYLARELHDDLNQQVAALAIGLGRLERHLPNIDDSVYKQITQLEDRMSQLANQIRRLSHELHSSTLEHVGLEAALKLYCSEFTDLMGITISLNIRGGIEAIPAESALCLYRVAQESLCNVAKHSGAKVAQVTLTDAGEAVELLIADQGVGFDPEQLKERQGLGLVSIEERVKFLHGSFALRSQPGHGTELRVCIPLRSKL